MSARSANILTASLWLGTSVQNRTSISTRSWILCERLIPLIQAALLSVNGHRRANISSNLTSVIITVCYTSDHHCYGHFLVSYSGNMGYTTAYFGRICYEADLKGQTNRLVLTGFEQDPHTCLEPLYIHKCIHLPSSMPCSCLLNPLRTLLFWL